MTGFGYSCGKCGDDDIFVDSSESFIKGVKSEASKSLFGRAKTSLLYLINGSFSESSLVYGGELRAMADFFVEKRCPSGGICHRIEDETLSPEI